MARPMSERALVLAAFALSGACGLVYEVVWTRELSLTFGITVFATATVLAAYMGGLGLGSWLVGRWIDRSPRPLQVYALLEIAIGAYALAVTPLLHALEPLWAALANATEGHFVLFNATRALLALAVLLVPTTLMGGTVPAVARHLVTRTESVGFGVGVLYALNTLGAVVGCLAAGFVTIAALGMTGSVRLAAALNVAIGVVMLVVARRATPHAAASPSPATERPPRAADVRLATAVFAASGFAALAAEVVWTRVLVLHTQNSTYGFTVMLAVFLAGIAVGDALLVRVYDRIARPLLWLGVVQALLALAVAVGGLAYREIHHVGSMYVQSFAKSVVVMLARAAVVVGPMALLLGTTFPLVARIATRNAAGLGRDVGSVYAANTLGGVAGSLVGGFVLVPLVGLRGTLLVLAALNALLGAVCFAAAARGAHRALLIGGALACGAASFVALDPTIFFRALETDTHKLIQYYEGATDTTGVLESKLNGERTVTYGDLRGTAGTRTDPLNRAQAHVAHLLHPAPRQSLQICFGVGNTLAAAALHPEVEQLDCVELSPNVRKTAPYFWTNAGVLDHPKVRLITDDGRNYLLRTRERYDVITLEPPDIFTAGVVNLYTEEFYRLAAARLADDGVLCQWIPALEMNETELRMLVRAFMAVFPETTLWLESVQLPEAPLLLVGTKRPLALDVRALAARIADPAVHADLVRIGMGDVQGFLRFYVTGPATLRAWVGDAPSVTDDRTRVDFTTPRSALSGFGFGIMFLTDASHQRLRDRLVELRSLYDRLREPFPLPPPRAVALDGARQ